MRVPSIGDAADNHQCEPSETSPLLGGPEVTRGIKDVDFPHHGSQPNGSVVADEEAVVNGSDEEPSDEEVQNKGIPEAQRQLKYIVPAISLGIFLSAADQTIIVASYGKIGSDLKALNLTSWIATSYFLTLTSFQPLYGRLSDIFGRKACLLFAYIVFGMGCVFCGLSKNIYQLIVARAFQGIGGGGMTTVVSIIMSDIVPLRDRGVWQGIINIIFASGSGIGAPLGGFLADSIGWRWSFVAQGPLCLIAFTSVLLSLKLPQTDKSHWRAKLRRVDFLGAVILVGAVFGFLLGLDRGSNVSWTLPITIASLSISAFLFSAFLAVELWVAIEPFAPRHIIFNRTLLPCYWCNFFSFAGWMSGIFYIPLFFQATNDLSATQAGLRLIPCILAGVSGSLFSGIVMKRTGKFLWITIGGYALTTTGMVVIFLFSGMAGDNTVYIIIGTVMCAFGNGIGVTTTLIALIAAVSVKDQAVVTACSYLFRTLGSVIGVSLTATVVQQSLRVQLRSALRDNKDIERIVDGVRQSLEFVKTLDPDVQALVRNCYGQATNRGFAFLIGILFMAFFSANFIREKTLSR